MACEERGRRLESNSGHPPCEALVCHTCRGGFVGRCFFRSTETCSDSQDSCFWGKLKFNNTRLPSWETRGCMNSTVCNQTEVGTLLSVGYTVTKSCCMTDCCNGATSAQLPLTAALGAALLAMWGTHSF
ncbi:protein Bouncer-like [Notolabrus celidotus]|uniref:protein Bouncer-like n=1 Tax=Notolabrus celidotus TaxID=1203425 RepID=UPI0014901BC0|nr:protein Bouncer-like [Notolabrus celidotus]